MSTVELNVPDIGDFSEVEVIEVLVAAGDTIEAEQSLITVESEKASMEIPASVGGVVKEVLVKVGDKVAKGSAMVRIEAAESTAKSGAASGKPEASAKPQGGQQEDKVTQNAGKGAAPAA